MVYHSGGGFTFTEAYNLPIWMRRFYIKELEEQLKKEADANKRASKGKSPNSRPPSYSKPSKPSMPSRGRRR